MATSRRLLRIGDYHSELDHRALVARLPRCSSCGVPVPFPTSTGECFYCWHSRRSLPAGEVAQVEELPIMDGEGAG